MKWSDWEGTAGAVRFSPEEWERIGSIVDAHIPDLIATGIVRSWIDADEIESADEVSRENVMIAIQYEIEGGASYYRDATQRELEEPAPNMNQVYGAHVDIIKDAKKLLRHMASLRGEKDFWIGMMVSERGEDDSSEFASKVRDNGRAFIDCLERIARTDTGWLKRRTRRGAPRQNISRDIYWEGLHHLWTDLLGGTGRGTDKYGDPNVPMTQFIRACSLPIMADEDCTIWKIDGVIQRLGSMGIKRQKINNSITSRAD